MKKLLLVDDTKTVHTYMKAVLKGEGFEYEDAFNGQEALALLEKHKFDLVLLDWEMPIMDGPTTLKKIVECYPDLPVIMVTTKNAFEDITAMLEVGAKDYLMKPFTKELLLEKMNGLEEGVFGNAV